MSEDRVTTHYFEDFETGARHPVGSREITDADHEAFCRLAGYDAVPLFVDDAYARRQGLPGRICPSHLIMTFSSAMTGQLKIGSLIAMVGIERVRFLGMVRPGDTLRIEVEVVEKRLSSRAGRGVVTFRDHVYNQRNEEVFCNDKIVLIRCRP